MTQRSMSKDKKRFKIIEILLIVFVWMVLLASPFMFHEEENFNWGRIMKPMDVMIPLLIVFLINRFILVPQFLFKNKRLLYFLSVLSVIALISLGSFFQHQNKPNRQLPPPHLLEKQRNPLPNKRPSGQADFNRKPPPNTRQMPPVVNLLIFSLLMVGFDTGLKASFRWAESEKEKAKLEKENVVNQLDMLRNQVNPHFFMNTLNNIHTLIDISSDKAKDAVVKLSKMMRYLLYDTAHGSTSLKKEVEFMESYINLMKLRVSDKVSISFNLPKDIPDTTLPPLLFTSFIENAFKHGISYQQKSFISIDLLLDKNRLLFQLKNSKAPVKEQEKGSGIGIQNARKRLELLYADAYHLDIIDGEEIFTVNLSIPI